MRFWLPIGILEHFGNRLSGPGMDRPFNENDAIALRAVQQAEQRIKKHGKLTEQQLKRLEPGLEHLRNEGIHLRGERE